MNAFLAVINTDRHSEPAGNHAVNERAAECTNPQVIWLPRRKAQMMSHTRVCCEVLLRLGREIRNNCCRPATEDAAGAGTPAASNSLSAGPNPPLTAPRIQF